MYFKIIWKKNINYILEIYCVVMWNISIDKFGIFLEYKYDSLGC